jgi:hypothetical protein
VTDAGAADRPRLRVIDASASPEEVAAILAAVTAVLAASGGAPEAGATGGSGSDWRTASRLRARGVGAQRGDWRRAERMGGRVPT